MNKTRFSEIIELPVEVQLLWKGWRDKQLRVTRRETIVENLACPLKSCRAIEGEECKTGNGQPTKHQSRSNEYFARLWLDSRAATGAESQVISSGKYPNG